MQGIRFTEPLVSGDAVRRATVSLRARTFWPWIGLRNPSATLTVSTGSRRSASAGGPRAASASASPGGANPVGVPLPALLLPARVQPLTVLPTTTPPLDIPVHLPRQDPILPPSLFRSTSVPFPFSPKPHRVIRSSPGAPLAGGFLATSYPNFPPKEGEREKALVLLRTAGRPE